MKMARNKFKGLAEHNCYRRMSGGISGCSNAIGLADYPFDFVPHLRVRTLLLIEFAKGLRRLEEVGRNVLQYPALQAIVRHSVPDSSRWATITKAQQGGEQISQLLLQVIPFAQEKADFDRIRFERSVDGFFGR
jgi:hypothetical protein